MVRVAGLDPAGTPKRYSGLAVLDDNRLIYINKLRHDYEIVNTVLSLKPVVIAIDSPLSYANTYREVDLKMKRMGYKVLPPGWRAMRMLVERSLRFKELFEKNRIVVIETHPYSALKSSGCSSHDELFSRENIKIDKLLSRDEYDALIAALVAKYYVEGKVLIVSARDGIIYLLPRICS
ncbi:MAG: hypothetical protein B6U89_06835 [Desulfurococcales archaeon ex4484_58]|nr:MAG: hypothetical protein B6U89_06835 [Desulfurococcales archaeon ex4484_58]